MTSQPLIVGATFFLLLFSHPGVAQALQRIYQIELPRKAASASCKTGPDHLSAILTIRNAVGDLPTQTEIGPYQVRFQRRYGGVIVATIDGPADPVRCRVKSKTDGLKIIVGTLSKQVQAATFKQLILEPIPLVVDDVSLNRMQHIDNALRRGHYERVTHLLGKLRRLGSLRDYAELRIGDLHYLSGKIPTAHLHYRKLSGQRSPVGVDMLARLRAVWISHLVDDAAPTPDLDDQVAALTGPTSQMSRRLLALLLRMRGQIDTALKLVGEVPRNAGEVSEFEDAAYNKVCDEIILTAIRRSIWNGNFAKAAIISKRYPTRVAQHPQRLILFRYLTHVYRELGLPAVSARLMQEALTLAKEVADREDVLANLTHSFYESGDISRAARTANFYLSVFPSSPRSNEIRMLRLGLRLQESNLPGAEQDMAILTKEGATADLDVYQRTLQLVRRKTPGEEPDKRWAELAILGKQRRQLLKQLNVKSGEEE